MKSLSKTTRDDLPKIAEFIKNALYESWDKTSFMIGTTPNDYIEIRIKASTVDSPQALKVFLNNLISTNKFL